MDAAGKRSASAEQHLWISYTFFVMRFALFYVTEAAKSTFNQSGSEVCLC